MSPEMLNSLSLTFMYNSDFHFCSQHLVIVVYFGERYVFLYVQHIKAT